MAISTAPAEEPAMMDRRALGYMKERELACKVSGEKHNRTQARQIESEPSSVHRTICPL